MLVVSFCAKATDNFTRESIFLPDATGDRGKFCDKTWVNASSERLLRAIS